MEEDLEFGANESWERIAREKPWRAFIQEEAIGTDGQQFMKARGRAQIYKLDPDCDERKQTYKCADCDSEIKGATVIHSVWEGPFEKSGFGRCIGEQVPYCPQCKEEPPYQGAPMDITDKALNASTELSTS